MRKVRKDLGPDAIIGAFCGDSRHDGMTAGELGADYVSFGPVGPTGLGDGRLAALELFQWWSEMIEVPCVAEGALTADLVAGTESAKGYTPGHRLYGLAPGGDLVWTFDMAAMGHDLRNHLSAKLRPTRDARAAG